MGRLGRYKEASLKETGLAETGRQVTVRHYKDHAYNLPQLAHNSQEGRWIQAGLKETGRQGLAETGRQTERNRE